MDAISVGAMTPLGALVLVLAFPYLQMARGKLVPLSTVERERADHIREKEDIQHDRDEWRATSRLTEQARQVMADQVDDLLEHARTTDAFIRAIPTTRVGE